MELHKAVRQIVGQFGKDVLTEERFVNILADVYPDRDNPALFGIIKTLVKDGFCSDLLVCEKNNFQTFISKSTMALNKKNGYDKKLVEDILNALAVGSGVVSPNDKEQPAQPTPAHSPKPASPKKTNFNTQSPSKPVSPKKQSPIQKHNQKQPNPPKVSSEDIDYIIIAIVGLVASSFLYTLYLIGTWWLFASLSASAIVYIFTMVPSAIHFETKGSDNLYGAWCAIVTTASLNTFITLFIGDFDSFNDYYNFRPQKFSVISFLSVLLICFVLMSLLLRQNHKTTKIVNRGFVICLACLVFVYQFFFFVPFYHKTYMNCRNYIVGNSRKSELIDLSFKDIKIGNKINSVILPYYIWSVKSDGYKLCLNVDDYSEFADSVLNTKSKWNNTPVDICIYCYQDTIHAIQISIDASRNTLESLVSMYKSKYGEPEIYNSVRLWDYPSFHTYYWHYKNGHIKIYSDGVPYILYIDNKFEELYEQKIALIKQKEIEENKKRIEEEKIKQEQQRVNDSLNIIRRQEQDKKKEIIRNKAIEEI